MTAPQTPDPDRTRIRVWLAALTLVPFAVCFGVPEVVATLHALGVTDFYGRHAPPPAPGSVESWVAAGVVWLLLGSVVVVLLMRSWRIWRSPTIDMDGSGMWLRRGGVLDLLPWSAVAAVGLSWRWQKRSWWQRGLWRRRSRVKHAWAMEIYLAEDADERDYPFLRDADCLRVECPPPAGAPELPAVRHLVLLPEAADMPDKVENAMCWWRPQVWIGRHERPKGLTAGAVKG